MSGPDGAFDLQRQGLEIEQLIVDGVGFAAGVDDAIGGRIGKSRARRFQRKRGCAGRCRRKRETSPRRFKACTIGCEACAGSGEARALNRSPPK